MTPYEFVNIARCNGRRPTLLQRAILSYMADLGGQHVYLSPTTRAVGHLTGYTWEGVNLSLRSLLKAGLIHKSGQNDHFWSLTLPNHENN